jgi:hypothetical protein
MEKNTVHKVKLTGLSGEGEKLFFVGELLV